MPNVLPFKSLCYQSQRIGPLNPVLADTPDIIDPAQLSGTAKRSEFNIARLLYAPLVGQAAPEELLQQWLQAAVLAVDSQDAMFIYQQDFLSPSGHHRLATSVVAVLELDKEIRPLAAAAPQNAVEAKTNISFGVDFWPVQLAYEDRKNQLEDWSRAFRTQAPAASVVDNRGTLHIAWGVTDPFFHQTVRSILQNTSVYLIREDRLYQAAWQRGGHRRVLACFSNFAAPETHCVHSAHYLLRDYPQWNSAEFYKKLSPYFHVRHYQAPLEQADFLEDLRFEMPIEDNIGVYSADEKKYTLLRLKNPQLRATLIPAQTHPTVRGLAWTLLQEVILKKLPGIPSHLPVTHDVVDALRQVDSKSAQAMFLLNPMLPGQLLDIASTGAQLPYPVASIYPRIPAGFIMRQWN